MSDTPHPGERNWIWPVLGVIAASLTLACLLAVLFRTTFATILLHRVLADRGMQSQITVDSIGFSDITLHGAVQGPGFQAKLEQAVVRFAWQPWRPRLTAVTITRPTVVIDLRHSMSSKKQEAPASLGNFGITVLQAHLIALTDAGQLELTGQARVSRGMPQFVDASILPTHLYSGSIVLALKSGRVSGKATPQGLHLACNLTGDILVEGHSRIEHTTLRLDVPTLTWNNKLVVEAPSARLSSTATGSTTLSAEVTLSAFHAELSQARASAKAAVEVKGSLPPDATLAVLNRLPLAADDHRAMQEIRIALQRLRAKVQFSWNMAHGVQDFQLNEPAELSGGDALLLRVMPSNLRVSGSALSGSMNMRLRAPGMPQLDLALGSFTLQPQALDGLLALKGHLSFGPLRNGEIDARGTVQSRDGVTRVSLERCADLRLGGYIAKRSQLVSDFSGTLCAAGGKPVLSVSPKGWTFQGEAKAVHATLPSAGIQIANGSANMTVSGATTPQSGLIRLAAVVSDARKARRFNAEKISGSAAISNAAVHAKLQLSAGPHATPIGTISAVQHFDTGAGTATLDFPAITFAPQGLQPAQISPMFATLSQADGTAAFSGHVQWRAKRIISGGRLDIDNLRFSSPVGKAQQLTTHIAFTSLLPLKTAPNQRIAIDRVDWVQPLTQSVTLVSLTPTHLRVTDTRTQVANGEVAITPLNVPLTPGSTIRGTVELSHLALGKLIAASNLGEKLKLEGSVSGSLPFTFGPSGLHFANGHIEADGPGRLSINHTLWGKGETNSVEKAAYQALENLSYQSLSATVQSVPGGRLRAVFRVAGYDDSRGTTQAEFNLFDLATGKAFQKEIPIPRGTAINLTLDISLNFDELLRGYQATWSQLKAMNGAPP